MSARRKFRATIDQAADGAQFGPGLRRHIRTAFKPLPALTFWRANSAIDPWHQCIRQGSRDGQVQQEASVFASAGLLDQDGGAGQPVFADGDVNGARARPREGAGTQPVGHGVDGGLSGSCCQGRRGYPRPAGRRPDKWHDRLGAGGAHRRGVFTANRCAIGEGTTPSVRPCDARLSSSGPKNTLICYPVPAGALCRGREPDQDLGC